MQDRDYKANTKATFKKTSAWLERLGYKLTSYGDGLEPMTAEAEYCKPGKLIRLKYEWIKNPNGIGYISGKMISLRDNTSCYSCIMGKETGYK